MCSWLWNGGMNGLWMGGLFGPILMIAFWALIIVGFIYLLKALLGGRNEAHSEVVTSLDILKKRYAKGEIDSEEYIKTRSDIEQ